MIRKTNQLGYVMKYCARHPLQAEFSLCGFAEDAQETEKDCEPFEFGDEKNHKINCQECLRAISEIYEIYTPTGRIK